MEAQRRKRNELVGELITGGKELPTEQEDTAILISEAMVMFLDHVRVHSPDKPNTLRRYEKVLEHFERLLGKWKFVEAISRADIDDYKSTRSKEDNQQHPNVVSRHEPLTTKSACYGRIFTC